MQKMASAGVCLLIKGEEYMKLKKIFKTVGKGAGAMGSKLYKQYKTYNSPKAQEARLNAKEQTLRRKVRIAQQEARIRQLQKQTGGNSLSGLGGFDMDNILNGQPRKGKRKEFDPFNQF